MPCLHVSYQLKEFVRDDESSVSVNAFVKRAQALVTLISQGITPNALVNLDKAGKESLGPLVSGLIALASTGDKTFAVKFGGLVTAAQNALSNVLHAMPAVDFVEAILFMLRSDNLSVCAPFLWYLPTRSAHQFFCHRYKSALWRL
jgi:hypothetical protein